MSLLNSSIGWANFQISGGLKRTVICMTAVAVVVPLLIFGSTQIEPQSQQSALRFWVGLLGVAQGAILGLFLPGRVHAAVRRDRASKLIESHRLMPTPASHAIAGYILGPNLLLLGCAAVVFVLGVFLSGAAGQAVETWVGLNVGMAVLALTLCCLVAFLSNWLTKLNPALLLLLVGPIASVGSATVVPALRVMFGSMSVALPGARGGELTPEMIVSVASQLAFAMILFIGACRRYRRDDVAALGFAWGFVLLALWVGLTLFGILGPQAQRQPWMSPRDDTLAFVVSTAASMLLSIGPIASASLASLSWSVRKRVDPHFADRRPMPVAIACVMVLALLSVLLIASPNFAGVLPPEDAAYAGEHGSRRAGQAMVLGTLAVFVATVGLLAWAAGRLRVPALGLIAAWIALTWIVPPLADGARLLFALDQNGIQFPSALGAVSPPFGLGAIYFADRNAALFGLLAQAGLMAGLIALWFLLLRRGRRASAVAA